MTPNFSNESFISYPSKDAIYAAQSMIAVSSMMDAIVAEYANTGVVAVGALQHCGHVVDNVIEKLGLAELEIEEASSPI